LTGNYTGENNIDRRLITLNQDAGAIFTCRIRCEGIKWRGNIFINGV